MYYCATSTSNPSFCC